jgi:histidinol-phosphate aminotransferase
VVRVPVRDDLRALEGYHSPQVEVQIRLNTNESPLAPPREFIEDLSKSMSSISWNRYPDRSASQLRSGIAELHDVKPGNVFVANGSNEVIQTLLLTFAGPSRKVVTFEPTYQLHAHIARITGAQVVEAERNPDFSLDEKIVSATLRHHQPDVTFLCSPNNPTGTVDSRGIVDQALAELCGLVAVDEAYGQFSSWSALELVGEEVPLVVIRTFSKTWSMAAARLGYLIGPQWLVAEMDKVVLPYHLDSAKQIAGTLALRYRSEMEKRVEYLIRERERVTEALSRLELDVFPSGANFILFRPKHVGGRELWQQLVERGVLIRDCSGWPRLANCLRVTIGTSDENDVFLQTVSQILSEVKS